MAWKKGESGNAKGRPTKNRALTTILEKAGNAKRTAGAAPAKKMLADLMWQAATEGAVEFSHGNQLVLEASDWIGVIKFLYQHIDGPPKSEIEHSGSVDVIVKGYTTVTPDDWDADKTDSRL